MLLAFLHELSVEYRFRSYATTLQNKVLTDFILVSCLDPPIKYISAYQTKFLAIVTRAFMSFSANPLAPQILELFNLLKWLVGLCVISTYLVARYSCINVPPLYWKKLFMSSSSRISTLRALNSCCYQTERYKMCSASVD